MSILRFIGILVKKISRKGTNEGSLDHDITIRFIEDYRLVPGIIRVGNEIYSFSLLSILFQRRFVIDQCDDDTSTLCSIRLLEENEISMIDSFLIHGVSLSSEEEVCIDLIHDLCRDGNLGFDIFLGEYRHSAGDSPDEGNTADGIAITLETR